MQQPTRPKKSSWLADQPLQRKMMLAIGLLLGLFLLTSLVTLHSLHQQESNRHWATHTNQVLLELDHVQRALQTSQIGARGYMLTQRADQRAMFESGTRDLRERIASLRKMTADNQLQQLRTDSLEKMAAQWQREMTANAVDPIARLKGTDTTAKALELQRIQSSYLEHRAVRSEDLYAVIDQMIVEENQLLTARNQQLDDALITTKVINIIAVLLGILLGMTVIRLTSQLVSRPLRRLTNLMTRLSRHDHDFEIRRLDRRDEIGEISRALQVFKQMSLDTEAQTWIRSRVADISHVLLQATTHKDFAQWLTSELVPLCKAGVGLFYSFDDTRQRLDLLGSYGLRLSNRSTDHYLPGEGLVGQCAIERKAIMLDDVPENYLHIDSGSGEALPSYVAILPVLYRDTLIGVLELAGFVPITTQQKQLLDELLPIVALTLENLNRTIHTHDLLLQTREQADDLRVSELVMRQQKEVLRDNNEALQAKTAELEEQSERLIASEEELRVQAEELQASNEELREKTDSLNRQKYVLEDLQQETADKAAELARASQYKSEFLANMSHELRTPLNSLLILSRSLADNDTGNLDEEQIESARIIHDAGNSLLHLINDILDLSKVEAGKMELVIDDLVLASLVQRLRRTFAHVAGEKGLDFTLEIEPDLPAILRTDGNKLEQIANNLLSNAFKFTAGGAVSLHIGRPDSETDVPEALFGQPLIAMTVSDSGIGIPPDKLQRVFNAFEQVDAGTSRQFGGTGLGLAISRRMAQLLGGDIVLRSESGRGSCFTVLLPETPPVPSEVAADVPHIGATRLSRATSPYLLPEVIDDDRRSLLPGQISILVIEDDPAFARILIDIIHRQGYRALAAVDGESGLQLAREHRPTGILLDVALPAMDGWTVLDKLKADDTTRAIPVHFISATDSSTHGLERGAVGFLTKPVSRESIGTALERLLHFAVGQRRHLLIVDDDAGSRTAVRTMLRADSVQIDEAGSAEEALEKIAHTGYDCIVLDLGLPGMSGLELLEKLADTASGVPPVVVYSGRELSREETLKLRQYTDAIVLKGARSTEQLFDEVSLFLHSIQHAPPGVAAESAAASELTGRRVMLVDDDMRNLFALSKVLRGWGLQVSMAQDGPKALKMLAEVEAPELVLMDIMMPGMDGYETIRAIRTQPHFASLPIIALTAKAMRGDREKCLEMGASDYLSKPIDIDKLASLIRVWLQR
ncbi:response regulator [Rhodanobacter glycinis]|uniref:histidine kinase n=1 Tax=Rhodanobacter glycinis TaxID=582702 RepID=A0A502CGT7_9GAMM|nr:response regulator [Rhodanobacter glycinis]TPG11229.1 response regulator [Rhodanobacter glycinis]TPG48719.1 response regulator [Rhodanobacter glycinis]